MQARKTPHFICYSAANSINLKTGLNEKSLENRYVELKKFFDVTHEKAFTEIAKAQEKQVTAQNNQTHVSHDHLIRGETVFVKYCKHVKKKGEDLAFGPYTIKDRNVDSGNYILEDAEGDQVKDSYLRCKLNPIENFIDLKLKIVDNDKSKCFNIQKQIEPTSKNSVSDETASNYSILKNCIFIFIKFY